MNNFWLHLFHQAFFGGIAAAGFGILFNCPPRRPGWQPEFGGILVFCCTGSGNCGARIAGIPVIAWLDSFSGRVYSDGSRKHCCQGFDESLCAAPRTSERGNPRSSGWNEKFVGGHFYAGGDRNGLGHPTTDLSQKDAAIRLIQKQTCALKRPTCRWYRSFPPFHLHKLYCSDPRQDEPTDRSLN